MLVEWSGVEWCEAVTGDLFSGVIYFHVRI